jgi:hypothetical protein
VLPIAAEAGIALAAIAVITLAVLIYTDRRGK